MYSRAELPQVGRQAGDGRVAGTALIGRAVLDDLSAAAATLRALRDLGVRVAIDDVGTGLSALAQLTRLPVDILPTAVV